MYVYVLTYIAFVSLIKIRTGKLDEKVLQDERGSERAADRASETHTPAVFSCFHCNYYKDSDGGVVSAKAEQTDQTVVNGVQGDTTWVVDTVKGTLTITPNPGTNGDLKWNSFPSWTDYRGLIKTIYIEDKICSVNMNCLFYHFEKLEKINGLNNINTESTVTMRGMFMGDPLLTSLDLSTFNTSKVTDMSEMFKGCRALAELNIKGFETGQVTDMNGMFEGCESLRILDTDYFNTNKVTNMAKMFMDCNELESMNVSNFDTSKVKDMSCMFLGCDSLKSIDVKNFDTSQVIDMHQMFNGCEKITSLFLSNFNTANVTNMYAMFKGCEQLTNLDFSNFNTLQVQGMDEMFYGCSNLVSLDLSSFDTLKVTEMQGMFANCRSLKNINMINFDTTSVIDAIKNGIINNQNNSNVFLLGMFADTPRTDGFSITFGPKCKTLSMTYNGIIYKKGIQYTLLMDMPNKNCAIKSVSNGNSFDCALTTDKNKQYSPMSYDNQFADSWTPDMAGQWVIESKIEKPVTKYMVTFKDGLSNSVISSSTVEAGTSVSVPSAPSHDGYRFISWSNQDRLTNIQSDVVVTAQYEKIVVPVKHYKVAFIDSVTNKVIIEKDAKEGDTVSTPEAPRHDGYVFVEWANKDKMVNVRSDCKITAVYREIKQTNDNSNQSNNSNNSGNANNNADNVNGHANIAANSNSDSHVEVNASNVNATNNNQMIDDNQADNLIQTGINQFYILMGTFAAIFISFVAYRYRIDK